MTRHFVVWLAAFTAVWGIAPALAQEALAVRTGSHDGYQRVVFDWPRPVDYTLAREGGTLTLRFTQAARVDLSALSALENVQQARVLAESGEGLQIRLGIAPQSRVRDVKVGERIIVDIYDPPTGRVAAAKPQTPPVSAPPPKQKPKREAAPAATAPKEQTPAPNAEASPKQATDDKSDDTGKQPAAKEPVVKETETPPASKTEEPLQQGVSAASTPPEQAEEPAPAIQPHVITITSTKPMGLAVFARGEWLWLVSDATMSVPPALSGPQVDTFGLMQRFSIDGGDAYRLKKPAGAGIVVEGGGQRWRVVLSPNPRPVDSLQPQRLSPVSANEQAGIPRRGAALLWPVQKPGKILSMTDPDIGDRITIATQAAATSSARIAYGFVELETLPSYAGLAYLPLADDVQAVIEDDGIRIGRGSDDLSLSMSALTRDNHSPASSLDDNKAIDLPPVNDNSLFHLARWQMGGEQALAENQAILMTELSAKEEADRGEDLLVLAKLMVANDRGGEAAGYLQAAQALSPDVAERAEFIGLRGAARFLADQPDLAIADLVNDALDRFQDTAYWRMATYAALEDWQRAIQTLPKDVKGINDYPAWVREMLSLAVAEVALRAGQVMQAERILSDLEPAINTMPPSRRYAWQYLMGEAARQLKQYEKAKEYWQALAKEKDKYYRVRAGLALTRLLMERNEIDPAQAIDRLESLRYAWRGDELEALTNYRLGRVYIDNKDYPKGLYVLRDAAILSPDSQLSREVTSYMTTAFRQLYDSDDLQTVSPLDSIAVYEEFKELMPGGAEGDRIVDQLAERMVDADLLGRAENLFSYQLEHRLKGPEAGRVALRLAAIRLLNNRPESALKNLDQAETLYKQGEEGIVPADKMREIILLRANALSKTGQADTAIEQLDALPADKTVARLKADIAWKNQRWREAADGLEILLDVEQIKPDQPLSPAQADLVLNHGIALNLSGDRVGLGVLRERYQAQMAQTQKAELFDVVTLPRRFGLIRSRDTIAETINNVDLFKDFLESYRKQDIAPAAGS